MLKIDDQLLAIEDAMDDVLKAFLSLEMVKQYRQAKQDFLADSSLQQEIQAFQRLQENYEAIKPYEVKRDEAYALRKKLLVQKRAIDMNSRLIRYRRLEVDMQTLLAELSQKISAAVSSDVFVDTGLPLAPHKRPHKSGRGNNIRERGENHAETRG
ncbi:YlbF family regulator [Streptococcus pantholopis]|uniref:YlbF family regulator n=1 Tax=Streptococcus pantholopis TaxID=1811193 RepID=A0A172QAE2_9STRE|nr:YlbF family regulator [Streptococcus pantholopis]AND80387.1 hypothetical protein A0O21_01725 [Streptococcus pantholopis]